MSSFTRPLKLEKISEGLFRTTNSFSYYLDNSSVINVPSGYTTDCASIPWPASTILKRDDIRWAQAAILHDWLYEHVGFVKYRTLSRKEIDLIFYNGMKILGAPWFTRNIIYHAVRKFGWIGYKNRWNVGKRVRLLDPVLNLDKGEMGTIRRVISWNSTSRHVMVDFDCGNTICLPILSLEYSLDR